MLFSAVEKSQPDPRKRKEEKLEQKAAKGSQSSLKTGYVAKQFENLVSFVTNRMQPIIFSESPWDTLKLSLGNVYVY